MGSRLYIETTIPSYLTARPSVNLLQLARQELTRHWWDQSRDEFELFISQEVIREASLGDPEMATARLSKIAELPLFDITEEVASVAEHLITSGVLLAKAVPDAVHISVASVHSMDYLLTWNCRQIANPRIQRKLAAEISARGHTLPVICAPEELTNDGNDDSEGTPD